MDNPFGTINEKWLNFYNEMSPKVKEVLNLLSEGSGGTSHRSNIPLMNYLDRLDIEDIKFIQTVMYVGREYNEKNGKRPETIYKEQKEELDIGGWKSNNIEINQMIGKAPLEDYLRSGLRMLNSN